MKGVWFLLLVPSVAWGSDHNNVEAGRPLEFDDAYSIGFGERSFGVSGFSSPFGLKTEFKYGFALNQDIGVAYLSPGSVEVSYFYGIQRETMASPGLGLRLDGHFSSSFSGRVRGVLTSSVGFSKVHLNLDLSSSGFGGVLGYSVPLDYPRSFDKTFLASVGYSDGAWVAGVGLRYQVDPRSVLDVGVTSGVRVVVGYSVSF